jgi:hypothetical protein
VKRSPSWSRTSSCACRAMFGAAGRRRGAPLLFGSGRVFAAYIEEHLTEAIPTPCAGERRSPQRLLFLPRLQAIVRHSTGPLPHQPTHRARQDAAGKSGAVGDRHRARAGLQRNELVLSGLPTHDWGHSNRLPPHSGMKPRPRRNGGLNPRSSTSPGLSMWRVDTKRGCKLLDAHVGKADALGGACGRSRRAPHLPLTLPGGDQPPSAYAGGSTALKTISMSCSGKASLDTPIRLLAHRGRATA